VDPFVFDRAFEAQVDLIEADQSLVPADYSDMTYTEAFDALVDQMRREYAFTEYKGIDWDAIHTELRPLFEAAEARNDTVAFQLAIRELTLRVPDGHVGAGLPAANDLFFEQFGSSIGMAIREVDDGRIIVIFLTDDGPAEAAGIEVGAEVTEIDGTPIADVVNNVVPFEGPFSTEHVRRYQQLRYAVRFPVNSRVEVTYRNPGDASTTTTTLFSVEEFESYLATALDNDRRPASALPVEFEVLPEGIGYVRINTFSRAPVLMLRLWEDMIDTLNRQQIPALIIDMRQNSGGFNLYNPMASYFFDEELVVGNRAQYYDGLDDFYADPLELERLILPPDGAIYRGPIAVLVGPNCASACEFFSYMMTLEDRAAIIGQYPTAGLGGGITPVRLPDGISFQFTNSRALNAEGGIRFEGIGIVPTERVPINEETLFYDGDVVLDAALDYLSAPQNVAVLDAGTIDIGETVEGEIQRGVRYRYILDVPDDVTLDFIITDEAGTTLRIYVNNETEPRITSNQNDLLDIPVGGGLRLVFEIGGINDITEGAYTLTVRESGAAEAVDVTTVDAGDVAVGDTIFGDLEPGTRLRYTLAPEADGVIAISLSDASGELDTYLRLYDADGNLIAENDDIETGVLVNSELLGVAVTVGEALIIEVGGFNDAAAGEFTLKVREAGG
jgi:C-terminal processing protease CtpA/Prc